jgi:hypothetical protein
MIFYCTSYAVNRPIYCVQAHSVTSTPALSGVCIKIVVLRVYSPSAFDILFRRPWVGGRMIPLLSATDAAGGFLTTLMNGTPNA